MPSWHTLQLLLPVSEVQEENAGDSHDDSLFLFLHSMTTCVCVHAHVCVCVGVGLPVPLLLSWAMILMGCDVETPHITNLMFVCVSSRLGEEPPMQTFRSSHCWRGTGSVQDDTCKHQGHQKTPMGEFHQGNTKTHTYICMCVYVYVCMCIYI